MRLILTLFCCLLLGSAHAQNLIPFAGTRPVDTAYAARSLRIDSTVRFVKYATSDSNKVLGIDAGGRLVFRTKTNSAGTDSTTFVTASRLNDTSAAIRTTINSLPVPTLQQVTDAGNTTSNGIQSSGSISGSSVSGNTIAGGEFFVLGGSGGVGSIKADLIDGATSTVFQLPNKTSGTYTIATVDDLSAPVNASNGLTKSGDTVMTGGQFDRNTIVRLDNKTVYQRDSAKFYDGNIEDTLSIALERGYRVPIPYSVGNDFGLSGFFTRMLYTVPSSGATDSMIDLWNATNGLVHTTAAVSSSGYNTNFSHGLLSISLQSVTPSGLNGSVSSTQGQGTLSSTLSGQQVFFRVNADPSGFVGLEDFRTVKKGIELPNYRASDWTNNSVTTKGYVDSLFADSTHNIRANNGIRKVGDTVQLGDTVKKAITVNMTSAGSVGFLGIGTNERPILVHGIRYFNQNNRRNIMFVSYDPNNVLNGSSTRGTYMGAFPFQNILTGTQNVGIGHDPGNACQTCNHNITIGAMALYTETQVDDAIAIGRNSLGGNTKGNGDIGIGQQAGSSGTTANSTFLGNYAGFNLSGTNNTVIGNWTSSSPARSLSNMTLLGGDGTNVQNVAIGIPASDNGAKLQVTGNATVSGTLIVGSVPEYADNAAAVAAGLAVGRIYRTGDVLKIVH